MCVCFGGLTIDDKGSQDSTARHLQILVGHVVPHGQCDQVLAGLVQHQCWSGSALPICGWRGGVQQVAQSLQALLDTLLVVDGIRNVLDDVFRVVLAFRQGT